MEHSSINPQNPHQIFMNDPSQPPQWSFEENKIFEHALAEVDHASPSLYQDIAYRIPWKSVDEIQEHYFSLIQDLNSIHLGHYPQPVYNAEEREDQLEEEEEDVLEIIPAGESSSRRKYTRKHPKPTPWTQQEHQMFLMGLDQYGRGDWKSISVHCVPSKTPMQVASHAQKYFRRLNNPTPPYKRRYSIHDTQMQQNDDLPDIENRDPISDPGDCFMPPNPNPSIKNQDPISNPGELPPNPANPSYNYNIGEGFVDDLPADNNAMPAANAAAAGTSQQGEDQYNFVDDDTFIEDLLALDPSQYDLQ